MTKKLSGARFRLFHEDLGLILLCDSGVTYVNQAGGVACEQMEAEGVYLPLGHGSEKLMGYFQRAREPHGRSEPGLTLSEASFIEQVLEERDEFTVPYIEVDWDRLSSSMEAWVHVIVSSPHQNPDFEGFGDKIHAILTWQNSD